MTALAEPLGGLPPVVVPAKLRNAAQQRDAAASSTKAHSHMHHSSTPSGSHRLGGATWAETSRPGTLATQWGRRLPGADTNEAARVVHAHWSDVGTSMSCRNPVKLEEAIKCASGTKYLRTLAAVRRSRSVPHLQKHALESALATHMVRARTRLAQWQRGMTTIKAARREKNVEALDAAMKAFKFTDDEPVVMRARRDLERWKHYEEAYPAMMDDAMDRNDVEKLRQLVHDLDTKGPRHNVGQQMKARDMVRDYEIRSKALRTAVEQRNLDAIEQALATWQVEGPNELHDQAQGILDDLAKQRANLSELCAADRPDPHKTELAIAAWSFNEDAAPEYKRALGILASFREAVAKLERLNRRGDADLRDLCEAVDKWPFATAASSCPALAAALARIEEREAQVKADIEALDGDRLEADWCGGRCVSQAQADALRPQVEELLHRYRDSNQALQKAIEEGRGLSGQARGKIETLVNGWQFSEEAASLVAARLWLQLQDGHDTLPDQADTGELEAASQARVAMGAIAFGTTSEEMNSAQTRWAAGCEHRSACLRTLDQLQKKDCQELMAIQKPSDGLAEVFTVVLHILAFAPFFRDDLRLPRQEGVASWMEVVKAMNDHRVIKALRDMVNWTPISAGLVKARRAAARFQKDLEDRWSYEHMKKLSRGAGILFEYVKHLFALDDTMYTSQRERFMMVQGRGNADSAMGQAASTTASLQVELEAVGAGMQFSKMGAVTWALGGRAIEDLDKACEKAQALEADMRRAMAEVEEKVRGFLNEDEPTSLAAQTTRCQAALEALPSRSLANAATVKPLLAVLQVSGVLPEDCDVLLRRQCTAVIVHIKENLQSMADSLEATDAPVDNLTLTIEPRLVSILSVCNSAVASVIPAANLAHGRRSLDGFDSEVSRFCHSFVELAQVFWQDFVPLRAAWAKKAATQREAVLTNRELASTVAALRAPTLLPAIISQEPAQYMWIQRGALGLQECQIEVLAGMGVALPSLHVKHAQQVAQAELSKLLESPPAAEPAARVRWAHAAIATCLEPLRHFADALSRMAKSFGDDLAELTGNISSTERMLLLVATRWVQSAANADWNGMKKLLSQAGQAVTSKEALASWSPLQHGSPLPLVHASVILEELWDWFAQGCDSSRLLQQLYIWLANAVSLAPLIPAAQVLAEPYRVAGESMRKLDESAASGSEPGARVWSEVRWSLVRAWLKEYGHTSGQGEEDEQPEDGSWWLSLLGCSSAKEFYAAHLESRLEGEPQPGEETPRSASQVASPTSKHIGEERPPAAAEGRDANAEERSEANDSYSGSDFEVDSDGDASPPHAKRQQKLGGMSAYPDVEPPEQVGKDVMADAEGPPAQRCASDEYGREGFEPDSPSFTEGQKHLGSMGLAVSGAFSEFDRDEAFEPDSPEGAQMPRSLSPAHHTEAASAQGPDMPNPDEEKEAQEEEQDAGRTERALSPSQAEDAEERPAIGADIWAPLKKPESQGTFSEFESETPLIPPASAASAGDRGASLAEEETEDGFEFEPPTPTVENTSVMVRESSYDADFEPDPIGSEAQAETSPSRLQTVAETLEESEGVVTAALAEATESDAQSYAVSSLPGSADKAKDSENTRASESGTAGSDQATQPSIATDMLVGIYTALSPVAGAKRGLEEETKDGFEAEPPTPTVEHTSTVMRELSYEADFEPEPIGSEDQAKEADKASPSRLQPVAETWEESEAVVTAASADAQEKEAREDSYAVAEQDTAQKAKDSEGLRSPGGTGSDHATQPSIATDMLVGIYTALSPVAGARPRLEDLEEHNERGDYEDYEEGQEEELQEKANPPAEGNGHTQGEAEKIDKDGVSDEERLHKNPSGGQEVEEEGEGPANEDLEERYEREEYEEEAKGQEEEMEGAEPPAEENSHGQGEAEEPSIDKDGEVYQEQLHKKPSEGQEAKEQSEGPANEEFMEDWEEPEEEQEEAEGEEEEYEDKDFAAASDNDQNDLEDRDMTEEDEREEQGQEEKDEKELEERDEFLAEEHGHAQEGTEQRVLDEDGELNEEQFYEKSFEGQEANEESEGPADEDFTPVSDEEHEEQEEEEDYDENREEKEREEQAQQEEEDEDKSEEKDWLLRAAAALPVEAGANDNLEADSEALSAEEQAQGQNSHGQMVEGPSEDSVQDSVDVIQKDTDTYGSELQYESESERRSQSEVTADFEDTEMS